MNLETSKLHESTAHPGVSFRVRQLNQLERTRRDAGIIEHQMKLADLVTRYNSLVERDGDGKVSVIPPENITDVERIDFEVKEIMDLHITPAIIRAGLVEVQGVTIDGQPATVDTLLQFAPATLLDEISTACVAGAGLTDEQQKN